MHNCIMPSSQLDFESEHTVIKTNKKNDWHGYYKFMRLLLYKQRRQKYILLMSSSKGENHSEINQP